MTLKKRRKRRLTKFGKLFFSGIFVLVATVFSFTFVNHQKSYYEKEENKNYIVEINYPNVKSKQLVAYSERYIENKKRNLKKKFL